jgi:hypothetical protein
MAIDDLEISFIAPSLCPHTSLILSIVPTCTVLSLLRSSSLDHVRIPRQLETEAWKWSGQIVAGSSHILRSSQSEASLIETEGHSLLQHRIASADTVFGHFLSIVIVRQQKCPSGEFAFVCYMPLRRLLIQGSYFVANIHCKVLNVFVGEIERSCIAEL